MNAMQDLEAGRYDAALKALYGARALHAARRRLSRLLQQYEAAFGAADEVVVVSAPGRTELGGNHTDHNGGLALAASVDADILAVAARRADDRVQMHAAGVPPVTLTLDTLAPRSAEARTSAALVRGVAAYLRQQWGTIGGFNAVTDARVPVGSGLSSSAAFEVLIGRILNGLFANNAVSAIEIAQIGQYAENVYYGKPSGLMDQMASSVGGLVYIDFADPKNPIVEKVDYDFAHSGYTLCTIDSGADHADLTDEYAAMPVEMKAVAAFFGKEVLHDVDEAAFYRHIAEVRKVTGDRAVLRAIHFFNENRRVKSQVRALKDGNFDAFLHLVNASGMASWTLLQNVTPAGYIQKQDMAFTIALCQQLLEGEGAVRIHGGGFAGTALAFVPNDRFARFKTCVEHVLGEGHCHKLTIQ